MRDGICMFALALCITLVYAPRAEAEEPILVNVVAQSVKPVVLEADPGTVSECHIVADGPGTVAICWDYLPGDENEIHLARTQTAEVTRPLAHVVLARGDFSEPTMCTDGAGSILVVWQDGSTKDIVAFLQERDTPGTMITLAQTKDYVDELTAAMSKQRSDIMWAVGEYVETLLLIQDGRPTSMPYRVTSQRLYHCAVVDGSPKTEKVAMLSPDFRFSVIAPLKSGRNDVSFLFTKGPKRALACRGMVETWTLNVETGEGQFQDTPYLNENDCFNLWGSGLIDGRSVCVFQEESYNRFESQLYVGIEDEGVWSSPLPVALRSRGEVFRRWFATVIDRAPEEVLIAWAAADKMAIEICSVDLASGHSERHRVSFGERVRLFGIAADETGALHLVYSTPNVGLLWGRVNLRAAPEP